MITPSIRKQFFSVTDVRAITKIESAKTDPVQFKWGFGEGLLKDKFAFFEAYKSPIPKRRKLPAKHPFCKQKGSLFKKPFQLDRVSFSTPEKIHSQRILANKLSLTGHTFGRRPSYTKEFLPESPV